jgi:hypothetical protein
MLNMTSPEMYQNKNKNTENVLRKEMQLKHNVFGLLPDSKAL